MREQWLVALSRVAEIHGARGDQEAQEEVLRRVLQADPYREPNYRALMGLLVTEGRSAEALVLYRRLAGLLWEEFQAHPDPETQQFIAQIRQIEQSS
jgi:DNA-binding SARP family transcriptional activator